MATPAEILDVSFRRAEADLNTPLVADPAVSEKVEYVARNLQNRAVVRLLLACLLAKVHQPQLDVRKPYTEISGEDSFSGRTYDEAYITPFVFAHHLPCNPTTAFLTPALRNRNTVLTPDLNLVGRPPRLYKTALELLEVVYREQVSAEDLLAETVRFLLISRNERQQRMDTLLATLRTSADTTPLSAEAIISLIEQHMKLKNASRLPVLVVAAAYTSASKYLGERVVPLQGHHAADLQTGSIGDVEITLIDDTNVITSYEMKMRRVTKEDVEHALNKVTTGDDRIDNYIFITTDVIDPLVQEYARSLYEQTGGIEFVILDCISFLRHFLHLFHRLRMQYLEAYQALLLEEPNSAVSPPLKEAFLAMRNAAESG